ncbi:MAG: hypothetical protein WBY53_09970 [Acidobacteriaceae bacterium]
MKVWVFAKRHHCGVTVEFRHLEVQDNEVRLELARFLNHLGTIGRFQNLVAAALQDGAKKLSAACGIVGNEDPRNRGSLSTLRASWES